MAKSWSPNNLGLWTSCKKNGGQPVHFTVCPWCLGIPQKVWNMKTIKISWWHFEARDKAKNCCQMDQISCPILLVRHLWYFNFLKIFEMLVKTFFGISWLHKPTVIWGYFNFCSRMLFLLHNLLWFTPLYCFETKKYCDNKLCKICYF